jgi:aminoglycoside 6'-N-acetyltransferase I
VSEEVSLRRATRRDQATVLAFHHALYVEFRDQIAAPDIIPLFAYKNMDATLKDDVEGLLGARSAAVFLAEREGRALGYVSGHIEVDHRRVLCRRGVVEDWYVAAEARGQGVGMRLLNALLDWFRADSCEVAESGTWAFNQNARNAHAKAGFTEIEIKLRRRL